MKYVLVDTANTFFRARHVVRGELDIKVGMAFHITFNSLKKAWNDFDADHIVFCFCLLYTSPSPRDGTSSRMPSSA